MMEIKRKRSTQFQLLQAMCAPKQEGRKSIFYAEGTKTLQATSTIANKKRDQIQTRRKTASEVRVLRSQVSIRPAPDHTPDAQIPTTSRAVMKRPKIDVRVPEGEESNDSSGSQVVVKEAKVEMVKVEDDDSDDSIQLMYDTKEEFHLTMRRRDSLNRMDMKLFAKCVRDTNDPVAHAVEMINDLLTAHEDFQADVIVANCGKMMANRLRKRKSREGKEDSIEKKTVDIYPPNKKERRFFYNLQNDILPGLSKENGIYNFERFPFPVFCERHEQVEKLFNSFTYIHKNFHKEELDPVTPYMYKCSCNKEECGSKCSCVQTSITIGGAFIYHNHVIVGGRVDGWTSAVFGCGPLCGCKGECSNSGTRLFNNSCLELFDAKEKGWGVRMGDYGAETGRLLFPFVGEIITETEHEKRQELGNGNWTWKMYRLEDSDPLSERLASYYPRKYKPPEENVYIDPIKMGNIGRFVNSSELPNAAGLRLYVNDLRPEMTQFVFYATRTIPPGEEILIDYGENYEGITICRCGQYLCPHDKQWQRPGTEVAYKKGLANFKKDLWTSLDGIVVPLLGQVVYIQRIQDQRQLCLTIFLLKEQIEYMRRLKLKKLNVNKLKDRIVKLSRDLNMMLESKPEGPVENDVIITHEYLTTYY